MFNFLLKYIKIIFFYIIIILYSTELLLIIFLPPKSNVHINLNSSRYERAKELGVYYDTRSLKEAFIEEKKNIPDLAVKYLFLFYLKKSVLAEDFQDINIEKFIISKKNDNFLIPFRGPINKKTLSCNEEGERKIVNNDKNGFKNPNKIYNKKIEIFLIGDSFAEGMCQDENNDSAGILRNKYEINSANFGVAGAGPLTSLAILKEYGLYYKPKTIFYFYYDRNDMKDLKLEKESFLINYLGEFNQNLVNRNREIKDFLNEYENLVYEHINKKNIKNIKNKKNSKEFKKTASKKNYTQILKDFFELRELKNIIFVKSAFGEDNSIDEDLFTKVLKEMQSETEKWNGKLIFVYLPDWSRFYHKYSLANYQHKKNIEKIVKSLDISYLDIVNEFKKEKDPIKLFPFSLYGHYTKKGYKILSKSLFDML